jgi:16S rRNA (guanine527-N7)-methyltransferase
MEIGKGFASLLSSYAQAVGVDLSHNQLNLFVDYSSELLFWNKKVNLVSVDSPTDLLIKHVIDSLAILKYIHHGENYILDIGSGAGFPGIPLKIAIPGLRLVLLEVSRKRVSFLKNIIRKFELTGTQVINQRIQDVIETNDLSSAFDTVISRATFKLPMLVGVAGHFLKLDGNLIAMKSTNIDRELMEAEIMAKNAGLCLYACHEFALPLTGDLRKIIIYKKTQIN